VTTTEDQPPEQVGPHLLAKVVRARREALGLTQDQVVELGGPSLGTQRSIENARADRYQQKTHHSIDDTFGWTRGTSLALLGRNSGVNLARKTNNFDFPLFIEDAINGTNQKPHKNALRLAHTNAPVSESAVFASAGLAEGYGTAGSPATVTADTTVTTRELSFGDRIAGLDQEGLVRLRDFIDGVIYQQRRPEIENQVAKAAMRAAAAAQEAIGAQSIVDHVRNELAEARRNPDIPHDEIRLLEEQLAATTRRAREAVVNQEQAQQAYAVFREIQSSGEANANRFAEGREDAEHGEATER
jgi:hypothetical protein